MPKHHGTEHEPDESALNENVLLVLGLDRVHNAEDQTEQNLYDPEPERHQDERDDVLLPVVREAEIGEQRNAGEHERAPRPQSIAEKLAVEEAEQDGRGRRRAENRGRDLHARLLLELEPHPQDDREHDRAVPDVADDHAEDERIREREDRSRVDGAVLRLAAHEVAHEALVGGGELRVGQRNRRVLELTLVYLELVHDDVGPEVLDDRPPEVLDAIGWQPPGHDEGVLGLPELRNRADLVDLVYEYVADGRQLHVPL